MNKRTGVILPLLFVCQIVYNQTVNSPGRPIAEIFTDFHLNLADTSRATGFALNRAYLGYSFPSLNNFSGTIIVNVGKPEDLAPGSLPRRYAYFREASINYSSGGLKITYGITGTHLFDFQQKFWGKRYIATTYQSANGYGFVADLGLAIDYQINDIIKADFTLMNGEGYTNVQLDNSLKPSLGLTITPGTYLAIRIYGDLIRVNGLWQPLILGFIGFRNDKVTIGAEGTYKSNIDLNRGHHGWGISGTGSVTILKQTELFGRFDYSTSVIPEGEINPWNYLMDGDFLVLGIQHTFSENVKIALDYQGIYPYATEKQNSETIYINALFKF
ncbi:MAG: hypothetical protein Q8868_13485 [Bacteroidota bacterium]|nr:hypothetical protein [Bacteroidota bacterium]